MNPLAVLRFDSSPAIGAGHASRCRALGRALARCGFDVVAATQTPQPDDPAAIELSGSARDEAAMLAARLPQGCDLLVVDHYGRDREFERACRPWAKRILVIDDLCDRPHDADYVLDPMPARQPADYKVPLGANPGLFLGADHAPLREAFVRRRHEGRAPQADGTIFVNFGGTDPTGLTTRTLDALRRLDAPERVVVVLGRGAAAQAEKFDGMGGRGAVEILIDPPDIAATMMGCDMAIGAGGVSALERCVLGLPSIAVIAADNQRETVASLASRGAAIMMEDPGEGRYAEALSQLLAQLRQGRAAIAAAAQAVCDGLGAVRVAAAVGGPILRDGTRLAFRPVRVGDRDQLLEWQRLSEIRRYSRNQEPPSAAQHSQWLSRKLADPSRVFEIATRDGAPAGVLRLDRQLTAGGTPHYEVSIFVLPEAQGVGAGKSMLAFARRAVPWARLVAEVLPGNDASHRLFAACGYRAEDGVYVQHAEKEAT